MTKWPLLFYVYSNWYKPEVLQVAESDEMKGSQHDLNRKESHETMAENTSQTHTPQVAETDQLEEIQPEMAENTSQTHTPQVAETDQLEEIQPEMAEKNSQAEQI